MLNGKLNLVIFISGGGTTMYNVLLGCKNGYLSHVNPTLVIASRPDAGGIEKALKAGLSPNHIAVIVRKDFKTREAYGEEILFECKKHGVDLIAQCGFIPIMPSNVIAAYRSMIFNQHPGPIDQARPGFGGEGGMRGLAVHHAVLHFARRVGRPFMTEATVHRVTEKVDEGAILGKRIVEIWKDDYAESLAERVLPFEHNLVLETILRFSEYGGPKEIHREEPLIRAGEETLLEEAKAAGIAAFPNG